MARFDSTEGGMQRAATASDVLHGPNPVINACNAATKAVRAAFADNRLDDVIEAGRLIWAPAEAACNIFGPLYKMVSATAERRELIRMTRAEAARCGIDNEPDAAFELWCRAAHAYYQINGSPHRRFISMAYRQNFEGSYRAGKSAMAAYDDLMRPRSKSGGS